MRARSRAPVEIINGFGIRRAVSIEDAGNHYTHDGKRWRLGRAIQRITYIVSRDGKRVNSFLRKYRAMTWCKKQ